MIGLKPGVGNMAAVEDVTLNPKRLKFVPVEGAQSARTFDDVTASVTYPSFARQAGLSEQDCLGFDNNSPDSVRRYAIRWVTTPERANDPRLLEIHRHLSGISRGQGHVAAAVWRPDRLSW